MSTRKLEHSHVFSSEIRLSKRQLQLLQLLAEGLTTEEIAEQMFVSLGSAWKYRVQLLEQLGARNAPHAVHQAHLLGILRH